MSVAYLTRKIRRTSLIKVFLIILLFIVWFYFRDQNPFGKYHPVTTVKSLEDINSQAGKNPSYLSLTPQQPLYYTGCDEESGGEVTGSFYYTIFDEHCLFFLLEPTDQAESDSPVTPPKVQGKLQSNPELTDNLIKQMAEDLSWTSEELSGMSLPLLINSAVYDRTYYNGFFFAFCFLLFLLSLALLKNLYYLVRPARAPLYRAMTKHMKFPY